MNTCMYVSGHSCAAMGDVSFHLKFFFFQISHFESMAIPP